jgi:hypothetical protein
MKGELSANKPCNGVMVAQHRIHVLTIGSTVERAACVLQITDVTGLAASREVQRAGAAQDRIPPGLPIEPTAQHPRVELVFRITRLGLRRNAGLLPRGGVQNLAM